MELVQDEKIVAQLENFFLRARAGVPVRGIEEKERAWYANEEFGCYQACVQLHGRITPIFAVPFTVVPR